MNHKLHFTNFPDGYLRDELTEHFYGDDSPKWKSQPTSEQAKDESIRRARLFRKHSASYLAEKLSACAPASRCLSGACPECSRATQRFFVQRVYKSLKPTSDYSLVSLIPPAPVKIGRLDRFSIADFRRDIASRLTESRLCFAFGGIDFSLNEHEDGKFEPYWSPHVWLVVSNLMHARWSVLLSSAFPRTKSVSRPIRIQAWDGKRRALGYAMKYSFPRRISYTASRSYKNGVRKCKNTRNDELRSSERFELYSYLDQIGIGARVLLSHDERDDTTSIRLHLSKMKTPTLDEMKSANAAKTRRR